MAEPSKGRILLVDDEALIRMGMRAILKDLGYEVVGEAADGGEALEKAAALRPDVVLMDIKMPGMNGLEATRRIMASHPVPIIVLTAYNQRSLVEEAADAGVLAYLMKPVRESDVAPAIEVARARFAELQWLSRARRELTPEDAVRGPGARGGASRGGAREEGQATLRVEAAARILRARYQLSEAQATSRLRRLAQSSRRTLVEVAEAVIALEAEAAEGG
ncbi:MAG TPA: response regulator [bacterium]|nr:response regulator [bacterium]